jgi:hypothetical protein
MRTAILASLLAAGCGMSSTSTDPGQGQTGTPEDPVPSKTGPYAVRTTVDFTIEAIAPPQVELVVHTLRTFSTNPAQAIIDAASAAGVPALGALYDALPSQLTDKLEGWIDDEINKLKIDGKPITEYAGDIAMLADIALTQFAVDSELDMRGTTAEHRLTALDLHPAGLDVRVPIDGVAGDILTQNPDVQVAEGGYVTLGEQHFGLNYGEYAWQGINAASTQLFGADVRTVLGNAVNCPNLAHTIASKCVLGVCVGHEGQLTDICNGGLDAIVNIAHQALAAQRLEAFHIIGGTVQLVDDTNDGEGDRLVNGTWDAELNLGLGLRHAPATFDGSR